MGRMEHGPLLTEKELRKKDVYRSKASGCTRSNMKESEFDTQVIEFMSNDIKLPTAGLIDNKTAHDVIRYPGATKRTVHFDRWLHFARSLCLKNKVTMTLIGTEEMMGDMFTKALDKTKFLKCRDYIMTEGH